MRKKQIKALSLLLIILLLTACTGGPATIETTPTPTTATATPTPSATPAATPAPDIPTSVRDLREALFEDGERLTLAQYDARYLFEQSYFPMSVFMYEANLIDELLTADIDALWDHTLDFWEFAVADIIFRELSALTDTPPHSDEELLEFADDFGLGNEHIADITFAEIDVDTRAFIIELLDMDLAWLSTYIGVAYNGTWGLQVFTLERMQDFDGTGEVAHIFCFIGMDARGSFDQVESTRDAFITAIGDAMSGRIAPSATTQRSLFR